MTRALAPVSAHRPVDGLDLWEQLAQAEAIDRVRQIAPLRPHATVHVGADTHVGRLKGRSQQTNQDAFWFDSRAGMTLLVVADGISVSTAGSGDIASHLLVRSMARQWDVHADRLADAPEDALEEFLQTSLAAANSLICEATLQIIGGALGREVPMGTTVVAAVMRSGRVVLASLGDSRAWVVGASGAASMTGDQNVRGMWLETWRQGEPMDYNGEGRALVGYVGRFDETGTPAPLPPAVRRFTLLSGESLVLSSDGLNDYAAPSAAALATLLEEACTASDPDAAARLLVDRANAGGGGDNVTVIVARQSPS